MNLDARERNGGTQTSASGYGDSSGCGSEELAEGEATKGFVSSAEDNWSFPAPGLREARGEIQVAENHPKGG